MILLPSDSYYIKRMKDKGRAVFTKKDILPGTICGDYLGKIINARKEQENEKKYGLYSFTNTTNTGCRQLDSFIWPNLELLGAHLINHSCSANCAVYPYKGHILYFTRRKIFKGEELTVDYLVTIPEKCENLKDYICFCHSPVCRGTMFASKEVDEKYIQWCKKVEGKYYNKMKVDYGEWLVPLKKYPRLISDYSIYDLYGNLNEQAEKYQDESIPALVEVRKRIRETGRCLYFEKLGVYIYGVMRNFILQAPKTL